MIRFRDFKLTGAPPLLSCVIRVRHLTFVQIALKELHYDNGVRVEQPALSCGTGSGGKPADKEHPLPAEGGDVSNPEPMLTRETCVSVVTQNRCNG